MGIFSVTVGVGHPGGGDLTEVSVVVDTGAYHTMLPESLLTQLHIQPIVEREIGFADGKREKRGIGQGRIAYNGEEWACPVIFGPEGQYLMGATTLEIMSLAADPVGKKLIPVEFIARPF